MIYILAVLIKELVASQASPVRKSDNQIKCITKLSPQAGSVRIALILSSSQDRGQQEEEERAGEERHDAALPGESSQCGV